MQVIGLLPLRFGKLAQIGLSTNVNADTQVNVSRSAMRSHAQGKIEEITRGTFRRW